MNKWHIGCSGFHYKHWKEVFYPKGLPQRKWFEYYCEHFHTLELNVTFYRFPQLSFLQNWYVQSPSAFSFAVKAPRLITHYKKFRETEELVTQFYDTVREGLQDKLGCVLFQLPPRTAYSDELLQRIIQNLDPSFNNVLEFRNNTWWQESVYKELAKNKITFCGMSHPQFPDAVIKNTSIVYYRFHGVPDLYKSPYSIEKLKEIAGDIEQSSKVKQAFIYFNNDIDASAIKNAGEMEAITQKKE